MTRALSHALDPDHTTARAVPGYGRGRTIVVVDDEAEVRRALRALLEREGHRVLTAGGGAKALALLTHEPADLLVIDYLMPVMSGELLIRAIRERDPLVQIVLQTGSAETHPPREMLQRLGVIGYHNRGDGAERLLVWVDLALATHDRLARLRALEQTPGGTPGAPLAAALDGLHEARALVAACQATAGDATSLDEGRRIVAELATVLAAVEAWTRSALKSSRPGSAEPYGAYAQQLHDAIHPLLVGRLGLAGDRLALGIDPELPRLDGDVARLAQALVELLGRDATAGAERRCVALRVTCADGEVVVSATDDGAGEVNGLGLAMARCILSADFGGTLAHEAIPGGGTHFTLRLPVPGAAPRQAPAPLDVAPARDNVSVLPPPPEPVRAAAEDEPRVAGRRRA